MKVNSAAIVAHFADKLAGKADVGHSASPANSGFQTVGGTMRLAVYDEYQVMTYPLKKDGTRTGKMKPATMPFIHRFCPHCGEKHPTA